MVASLSRNPPATPAKARRSEQKLLMMRPHQVYQVKAIVECIRDNSGNGYIWSTTGSGKTLTSCKASTLIEDHPDIEKCLFVVDRKDLDRQTREDWSSDKTSSKGDARRESASHANQFNKFQEGGVEENTITGEFADLPSPHSIN